MSAVLTRPPLIEEGVYDIPLQLEVSLEPQRATLQQILWAAQRRLREFAAKHGWLAHIQEPFAVQAHMYNTKAHFDHDLLEICGLDTTTVLPKTYCAALEQNTLLCVSPERYREVYPEGEEEDSFEKLITHEMAHRLHIRILAGDEEAMGPVWFYEGFALYAAGQFERTAPHLSVEGIWKVVSTQERGDYRQYATVFRYFLGKVTLHQLIEMAGREGFTDWLRHASENFPHSPWPADWSTCLGQRVTVEGTALNAKLGALLADAGHEIWIADLDSWPAGYYLGGSVGRRVRVTGTVVERHDLPVFIPQEGEPQKTGIPVPPGTNLEAASRRYLLADAHWELFE